MGGKRNNEKSKVGFAPSEIRTQPKLGDGKRMSEVLRCEIFSHENNLIFSHHF